MYTYTTMIVMMPKNESTLEREYSRCVKKKKFVEMPKEKYIDYVKEAYSDIASAEEEVEKSPKWAVVKAYQALFLMSNALLVRKTGFYSKDHGCILIALMKENALPEKVMNNISALLKNKKKNEDFFEEVSDIRIARNKYLYLPQTQRKLNISVKELVDVHESGAFGMPKNLQFFVQDKGADKDSG